MLHACLRRRGVLPPAPRVLTAARHGAGGPGGGSCVLRPDRRSVPCGVLAGTRLCNRKSHQMSGFPLPLQRGAVSSSSRTCSRVCQRPRSWGSPVSAQSLPHSFTPSFSHTRMFAHGLTHSLMYSFIHFFLHSLPPSFILSVPCSFPHSLPRSLITPSADIAEDLKARP